MRACPPFLKPHFSLLCTSSPTLLSSSPPIFFSLLWDPLLAFQMLVLLSWALCSSVTMDPPFGQTYLPPCDDAAEICILPSILLISITNQACPKPVSHHFQSQVFLPLCIPHFRQGNHHPPRYPGQKPGITLSHHPPSSQNHQVLLSILPPKYVLDPLT